MKETADRQEIFNALRVELKKYEGPYTPHDNFDSRYDLWSHKDIVIDGRKKKEVWFAGLIIQSGYVGFYFMPYYTDREGDLKKGFSDRLLALLKGKSCFHVKKLDEALLLDIRQALEAGHRLYRERGWVDG